MSDTSNENPLSGASQSSSPADSNLNAPDQGFPEMEVADQVTAAQPSQPTPAALPADDDEVFDVDGDYDVPLNYTPSDSVTLTDAVLQPAAKPASEDQHTLTFPSIEPSEFDAISGKLEAIFALYSEMNAARAERDEKRYRLAVEKIRALPLALRQRVDAMTKQAPYYGLLDPTRLFNTPDDDWSNQLEHDGKKINSQRLRPNSKDPIAVINNRLGVGTAYRFPLWHSGLWVSFAKPESGDLLELDQNQQLEKEMLGRYSMGLTFSNSEVYHTASTTDFALRRVLESSLGTTDLQLLKRHLLVTDIPLLIHHLATTLYPKGYRLTQPCLAKTSCGHVSQSLASLQRMVFLRRSRLTHPQRALMARLTTGVSEADVRDYQSRMRPELDRKIYLDEAKLSYLRLAVPTVFEQEVVGMQWVNSVVDSVRDVFGSRMSEQQRIDLIDQKVALASVMNLCHWIEAVVSIDEDTGEETVLSRRDEKMGQENSEKLNQFLTTMCQDLELGNRVETRIREFITDMTIAYTAVPKVPCPNCQQMPEEQDADGNTRAEYAHHPRLIQIDPSMVFFILRRQYLERQLTSNDTTSTAT